MRKADDGYWFVPKAFGIGATPVTWQGWALTIGFVALAVLDMTLMPDRVARIGVLVALLLLFTLIALRKTRGGWSWRWGGRG
ncbi:hypothetical protein [Sphingomonas echinoides]|uniref:hypothetical protein n=1 Tax=Sphingomonas echinoides TaxID=59803 RepID=UPI00241303FD|nr:hypothetical protein [Sphingomonas echinoides]